MQSIIFPEGFQDFVITRILVSIWQNARDQIRNAVSDKTSYLVDCPLWKTKLLQRVIYAVKSSNVSSSVPSKSNTIVVIIRKILPFSIAFPHT